jgi:thiamine pyrophosphokinase
MSQLIEAADLLDADLVWSPDLDSIRYHLSAMLRAIAENRDPEKYATDLAETLLDEHHNDISLG